MSSSTYPRLRLLAPYPEQTDTPWLWAAFDESGAHLRSACSPLSELPAATYTELIIPARAITAIPIALPSSANKYSAQIIEQALDDYCLGERTAIHAVPGIHTDEEVMVWLIQKDYLSRLIASAQASGHAIDAIFPEYALLPISSSGVQYACTQDYYYFRDESGKQACVDDVSTLYALYAKHTCFEASAPFTSPIAADGVNLLQGAFRPKFHGLFSLSSLKTSVFLLATLLIFLIFHQFIQWQSLQKQQKQLNQAIRQTFATRFPGTPIIDPIAQWQQKLAQSPINQSQYDALELAKLLADRLQLSIHPQRLEIRDHLARIVLSENEAALLHAALEKTSYSFTFSPAENGMQGLEIRLRNE